MYELNTNAILSIYNNIIALLHKKDMCTPPPPSFTKTKKMNVFSLYRVLFSGLPKANRIMKVMGKGGIHQSVDTEYYFQKYFSKYQFKKGKRNKKESKKRNCHK